MAGPDLGSPGAGGRRPHDVAELPHVAGPGGAGQGFHGIGGEALGFVAEEVHREQRNVAAPVAQPRQRDLEAAEPIVEVLAQVSRRDHGARIAVRGRHEAHRDLGGPGGADREHFAVVEHAQELRLVLEEQRLHLVEEEHTGIGAHQQTLVIAFGAREGAPTVAEELALEQVLRHHRAVVGHEGAVGEGRVAVDGPGHQLLARTGVAGDQHGHGTAGSEGHEVAHLDDGPALPDELGNRARNAGPRARRQSLAHGPEHSRGRRGLEQVVDGAELDGFDDLRHVRDRRHGDHRQLGPALGQPVKQLEAVHLRHVEVGDHEVVGARLQRDQGLDPVAGGGDLVALLESSRRRNSAAECWSSTTRIDFATDQDRPRGSSSSITVPRPAPPRGVSRPPASATIRRARNNP